MPTPENKTDNPAPKYRLIVADDDPTVQRAIEWLLRRSCEIVCRVTTHAELVDAALALQPDVIISDAMMPALFGSEALLRPGGGRAFAVVLISDEPRALRQWIEQGARCVVHTMDLDSDLETAVQAAVHGSVFISPRAIGPANDRTDTH